ncbi:MAG: hypothetical protein JJE39_16905 [Vicinamibacteria bacterium]|nr:hypothetical protein [Vicinamibacteria bacterium]
MPTLGALLVASLVSYLVGDLISGFAGLATQLVVGTAVFYVVYFPLRNWLREMRDG